MVFLQPSLVPLSQQEQIWPTTKTIEEYESRGYVVCALSTNEWLSSNVSSNVLFCLQLLPLRFHAEARSARSYQQRTSSLLSKNEL